MSHNNTSSDDPPPPYAPPEYEPETEASKVDAKAPNTEPFLTCDTLPIKNNNSSNETVIAKPKIGHLDVGPISSHQSFLQRKPELLKLVQTKFGMNASLTGHWNSETVNFFRRTSFVRYKITTNPLSRGGCPRP